MLGIQFSNAHSFTTKNHLLTLINASFPLPCCHYFIPFSPYSLSFYCLYFQKNFSKMLFQIKVVFKKILI